MIGQGKLLTHKKGFTLIEVLVSTAILSVVMVMVISVFTSVYQSSRKAAAIGRMKTAAQPVLDLIDRQVRSGTNFSVSNNALTFYAPDNTKHTFACIESSDIDKSDGSVTLDGSSLVSGFKVTSCSFGRSGASNVYVFKFTLSESYDTPARQEFRATVPFQLSVSVRNP